MDGFVGNATTVLFSVLLIWFGMWMARANVTVQLDAPAEASAIVNVPTSMIRLPFRIFSI